MPLLRQAGQSFFEGAAVLRALRRGSRAFGACLVLLLSELATPAQITNPLTPTASSTHPGPQTLYADVLAIAAGKLLYMDTQDDVNCNGPNGSAVITCSDGPFKITDSGKYGFWVDSAGNYACARQFIKYVSSTQVIVPVACNNGNLGAGGHFKWGHDDTAAWDAVNTAYTPHRSARQ